MLHTKLECNHFLVVEPKELNYNLPDVYKPIYCPTCKKDVQIISAGSVRKEILKENVDMAEMDKLKVEQPHLTIQQCVYILQRRRPKVVEIPTVDNYDIFQDRVKSLLVRWERFKDNHPDIKDIDKICVTGAIAEISDEYSKNLGKV